VGGDRSALVFRPLPRGNQPGGSIGKVTELPQMFQVSLQESNTQVEGATKPDLSQFQAQAVNASHLPGSQTDSNSSFLIQSRRRNRI
jgi:hypothetical protein